MDLIVINLLFQLFFKLGYVSGATSQLLLWNFTYLASITLYNPGVQERLARMEIILTRVINTTVIFTLCFHAIMLLTVSHYFDIHRMLVMWLFLTIGICISRLIVRSYMRYQRSRGTDRMDVVFVGAGINLRALYESMARSLSTGYHIHGYFEDQPSRHLGDKLPCLGTIASTIAYLETHKTDLLFCNLPSSRAEEITELISYCENHLIHFYSVPNVKNYVNRAMTVEYIDNTPVLSLRPEPLRSIKNRLIKRTFDLVFSLSVLLLLFWWIAIIVAIITKITMPGPVFFIQKRTGFGGKEFRCIKFRSMKVNADADRVQSTKDDPRKTKWGNFMRKANIDELPQFINVLLGQMSVVGPRPHMVYHTEEYAAIIDRYMVRHFAKPGITGWAQVTGSRGETPELWMMEERVKKDIYYIENWSIMLDIRIIYMTIVNALGAEIGNAY